MEEPTLDVGYGVSYPESPGEPGSPWTKIDVQAKGISIDPIKRKQQLIDLEQSYSETVDVVQTIMYNVIKQLEEETQ